VLDRPKRKAERTFDRGYVVPMMLAGSVAVPLCPGPTWTLVRSP
jgi:hypothetical protein